MGSEPGVHNKALQTAIQREYAEGLTLRAIGAKHGLSHERVRQILINRCRPKAGTKYGQRSRGPRRKDVADAR
jgi:hypothetical protein